MRLDARDGDTGWTVWHVEECRSVPDVLWVDDETARFCTIIIAFPHFLEQIHQAKKILIYTSRKLVLINPIADEETEVDVSSAGATEMDTAELASLER